MKSQPVPKPIRQLTESLLEAGGFFTLVINQMMEFAERHPNPQAKSVPDVLHDLVGGILAEELKSHPEDVATTARVISAAVTAISENLFFVDDSLMDEAAGGRPELN